ncbi:MAG: 4-hydroxythreonine-4-phosphate dehydrogenase PdxA [Bacteroidales bacterium]|jgi:4-hydroxythreonine-4-phosphate dehydrogenase|nr:4-hydroxythreonine-4-phosphate dehydrogenase PdxA [Bacteroidales bacterium]
MTKIILGITQGDTNGIGYEVIIKALSDARMLDMCTPIIYGSSRVFGYYRKRIPETEHINTNIINSPREARPKRVNIINCINENFPVEPGQLTPNGSDAAIASLERCTADLKAGLIDIMVTAPFNKRAVTEEQFKFPGHTEYLVNQFGARDGLMFLCSDSCRVGVATNHLPISKVSSAITEDLILSKLKLMNDSLKRDFLIVKPKLAVLGLNPHAGDRGLLGNEENDVIIPSIKKANDEGILTFGPYSPDGFFSIGMQFKFDAVLAMYHDQGLIPFKALSFDSGYNFTAGLPIVRTSPDHGTAFDVAGKNKANPQSMISAIYAAIDIYGNRKKYDEMYADPLKEIDLSGPRSQECKNSNPGSSFPGNYSGQNHNTNGSRFSRNDSNSRVEARGGESNITQHGTGDEAPTAAVDDSEN